MRLVPLVLVVAMVPVGLWGVAQAQAPKTLVIAIGADQTGLDPQTVENNESGFIMSTIYDSIVNYKPGSSLVGPGLAEKWEVSPDGLVYTFHFRHGVRFHDGTPMNARTVAQWDYLPNDNAAFLKFHLRFKSGLRKAGMPER